MTQKTINDKIYFLKEDIWYGTDKNNKIFKIGSKVLLDKLNAPEEGLGDMISKITTFLGIKPCESCNKRKNMLNNLKLFPHLRTDIRELNEKELLLMDRILSKPLIQNDDVNSLFELYNSLFKTNLKRCNCPGLVRTILERINTIIDLQLNRF